MNELENLKMELDEITFKISEAESKEDRIFLEDTYSIRIEQIVSRIEIINQNLE
tara:strand:+ start:554 stop:715 length:162 start_codon:yes stop_codon:yes gene_type:complete